MRIRAASAAAALSVLVLLAACGGGDDQAGDDQRSDAGSSDDSTPASAAESTDGAGDATPYEGYVSEVYAGEENWACLPGGAADVCDGDLAATVVGADGSLTAVAHEAAADAAYDCFYVYPTLDYSEEPGNHPFEVVNPLEDIAILNQAARFTEQCRVFVPRYRQATIGSYDEVDGGDMFEVPAFQTAYADVLDAFKQYMANENDGRNLVLLGHSQGTHHLVRLLQEEFDENPALQEQLISALLVGDTGRVTVPEGGVVGGTFATLPLCTAADETGCLVAFDSFWEGAPAPVIDEVPDGVQTVCVNPVSLLDGDDPGQPDTETAAGAYISSTGPAIPTAFELVEDGFTSTCTEAGEGQPYLEVGVDPEHPRADALTAYLASRPDSGRSLHTSDWAFPQRDLLALAQTQAAAMPG
jgi:hypothetical protein